MRLLRRLRYIITPDGSSLAQLRSFIVNAEKGNLVGEHAAIVIKRLKVEGMHISMGPWLSPKIYQYLVAEV
jgi:hypothetical protein